ncbi:odorant receptor 4-like [Leptidea sinapis]|uniref:odorant receptor 4-like n=1 Tax=Leptidea sinapis TaxID=189913 RepID=UPI0021C42735|nr:odorant receptor 4-like [Leptidea sinapis]
MVFGELFYVFQQLVTSSSVVDFVASLHIAGYDSMSFGKLLTIWYKRDVFKNLLIELADIWPISEKDFEANSIKLKKLSQLRITQFWYAFWNLLGLWLYNLTPIAIYMFRKIQGSPADLGLIWHVSYPFDKTQPVYHEVAFIFETYGGVVSVWSMLGSDILFMTMSSHISMLLRLLQLKISRLSYQNSRDKNAYDDIVAVVKIHQRLINYGKDLEEAFALVNLINVLLSSVNICCVVFNISAGVADAVYDSAWYNSDARCKRILIILIKRYLLAPILISLYCTPHTGGIRIFASR